MAARDQGQVGDAVGRTGHAATNIYKADAGVRWHEDVVLPQWARIPGYVKH